MQFSLRSLLLFIGAICISLALTRVEFLTSCLILIGIIAGSGFFVTKNVWRFAVYGSISGIVCGYLTMMIYMLIDQGRVTGSTYAELGALDDIKQVWRPYIMHVGGLVGATLGLIICSKSNTK